MILAPSIRHAVGSAIRPTIGRVTYPGDLPSLDLPFAQARTLDPRVEFTRGGSATNRDAAGLIATVGNHVPRFEYDASAASRGLLIEASRANLLLYSSQFENAAWSKANCAITSDAAAAPDGTGTADLWARSSTGAAYCVQARPRAVAVEAFTFSIFARKSVGDFLAVRLQTVYPARADLVVNLTSGAITTAATASGGFSAPSGRVESFPGGWWRVSISGTTDATNTISGYFSFNSNGVALDGTDSAANSAGYVWGAQVEPGAFATSLIPTTSSSATRADDVATISGGAFSSWFNAAAGTFLAECFVPASGADVSATLRGVLTVAESAATTNRLGIGYRYNGAGFAHSVVANASEFQLTPALPARPAAMRFAFAYSSGSSALTINGAAAATSAAPMNTAALRERLLIGASDAATNQQITLARIRYWRRPFSAAALVRLSTL